jgi:thiosulfate/3-mercaptopyruvate sulfurtransferase
MQFEFPIPEMAKIDDVMKANLKKLLGSNKNRTIVFYCGFVKCTRSHNAAMWAVKLGYKNVYRQPGGIKAWFDADYPVENVK